MDLKEHRKKVLKKLNFQKVERTNHEEWTLTDSKTGRLCALTRVSRGNQDIGNALQKAICEQLHVNKQQYKVIAACTMGRDDYFKHLNDKGIIPPSS